MYTDESEAGRSDRRKASGVSVNEFLSAISETEYPQYVLEAIGQVQAWMKDMLDKPPEPIDEADFLSSLFGEEEPYASELFDRLRSIEPYADVMTNSSEPGGKPDIIIISIAPPDCDSAIRSAVDYAAVFNRSSCKRVWIISDTFVFGEVVKFAPHVDALAEQGIMLRYILLTPWGWVEMPLSGKTVSKHQLLWRNERVPEEKSAVKTRRRRSRQ